MIEAAVGISGHSITLSHNSEYNLNIEHDFIGEDVITSSGLSIGDQSR